MSENITFLRVTILKTSIICYAVPFVGDTRYVLLYHCENMLWKIMGNCESVVSLTIYDYKTKCNVAIDYKIQMYCILEFYDRYYHSTLIRTSNDGQVNIYL